MEPDEGLARRARDGDREAFEELVRRTTGMIYARLYMETGDPQLAEDLVQETYLRAFRSIHRLGELAAVMRWLLSVAHSASVDSYRRGSRLRRAAPRREGRSVLEGVAARPAEDPETAERRERVRSALQSLPEEYRLPLVMRYVAGADYHTMTIQLGLGAGALRGLLYRGLQLLRLAVKSEVANELR